MGFHGDVLVCMCATLALQHLFTMERIYSLYIDGLKTFRMAKVLICY